MKTILISLLTLLTSPPAPPFEPGLTTIPALPPLAMMCTGDDQDPMMGDPHGPPVVCMVDGDADFPLKHGSCGANCTTHVPASGAAQPTVPVRIDFYCPNGVDVRSLSYRLEGQPRRVNLVRSSTGSSTFSVKRDLRPFSKTEVAASCAKALGGSWPTSGTHANTTRTVETTLRKEIELWGGCGTEPLRHSKYRISLTVTCEDKNF